MRRSEEEKWDAWSEWKGEREESTTLGRHFTVRLDETDVRSSN